MVCPAKEQLLKSWINIIAELLDAYLNGPRLLSATRTSFLIVAREPGSEDEWHLVLCAMHCIGDGMALHACANEILLMLGSEDGAEELERVLGEELERKIDIPRSMEATLPEVRGRLKNAVAKVDEGLLTRKQIVSEEANSLEFTFTIGLNVGWPSVSSSERGDAQDGCSHGII